MNKQDSQDITALLVAWRNGDGEALNQLMPLVHDELRQMARRYMSQERAGHTLQTTALVNEVYLRLVDVRQVEWQDRAHFFSFAAQLMRRVLVDFARTHNNQKHGSGLQPEALSTADVMGPSHNIEEILAVHEALERLAVIDKRCSQVVEMRFFGGLTNEEIAEVLQVTDRTVRTDWSYAKMWLRRELTRVESDYGRGH